MVGPTTPLVVAYCRPPTPIVFVYFTESAKNASSAVTRFRKSDFIDARYAFSCVFANFGIAIAAKMPMITTTIRSSISVNPLRFTLNYLPLGTGSRSQGRRPQTRRAARWSQKKERRVSPPPWCFRPKALDALRLALFVGRGQRRRTHVNRAGLGRCGVRHGRRETVSRHRDGGANHATGRGVRRAEVARVLHRVGEIRLFGRDQVAQIGLHRREIRLFLRVRELRNRDRGQNADDHDHDQKLNQCETLAIHLDYLPEGILDLRASSNDSGDTYYSGRPRGTNCALDEPRHRNVKWERQLRHKYSAVVLIHK